MALLTTEDVLNKTFQTVKFREGYEQIEVDEFLDEVVATLYALQVENQELKEKLENAERRIAELQEGAPVESQAVTVTEEFAPVAVEPVVAPVATASTPEPESATSMLALAQRVHDEYVRDGREKSEEIIADARSQSAEILRQAETKRSAVMSQLDQDRNLLESKINELRTFESDYRASLKEHLEKLLGEVAPRGEDS